MDSLKKGQERRGIQHDIFSGFLAGLRETEELSVDFNEKLFHRLVDFAMVYSDGRVVFTFCNGWKPARRFKSGSGRGIGFCQMPWAVFSMCGNRVLLCMEISE